MSDAHTPGSTTPGQCSFGSIRTVSKRYTGTQPERSETVLQIDRSNPVLGNRHHMRGSSLAERERVIAAHAADIERDAQAGGPIHQALIEIAGRVARGEHIALACWCAPAACHGDNYVRIVSERARALVRQPGLVAAHA